MSIHGNKGKKLSTEHKRKLSISHIGQTAWNKNKKMSNEFRKKVSLAVKGRKMSPETKLKISKSNRGKIFSLSHRLNLSKSSIGKVISIDHREKISRTLKGRNIGKDNPFWKGGITKISIKVRNMKEYENWRKETFKRDKYTCQICRRVGVFLNADHYPVMFSEIMKNDNIKTISQARKNNRLWDIDNGRTLCKECHLSVTFNK